MSLSSRKRTLQRDLERHGYHVEYEPHPALVFVGGILVLTAFVLLVLYLYGVFSPALIEFFSLEWLRELPRM